MRGISNLWYSRGSTRLRLGFRSDPHNPSDNKDRQDCDQAAPGLGDESAAQNLKG